MTRKILDSAPHGFPATSHCSLLGNRLGNSNSLLRYSADFRSPLFFGLRDRCGWIAIELALSPLLSEIQYARGGTIHV
jgi:hypothetical protein